MKFKVGDKVRVKPFIVCISQDDFVSDMEKYCGKILTISTPRLLTRGYKVEETHWTFYDEMLEPITPVKKGIYIKVEKAILPDGSEGYRVLEFSALPGNKLPDEYRENKGSICYVVRESLPQLIINSGRCHIPLLIKGRLCKKEHFLQALEKIKVAGNMLAEINKKLKWSGIEEFTI